MLKITAMFGNFDRLPGGDMAQAIDLARIVDDSGLYGIAIGEHVSLTSAIEDYPYAGGLANAEGGRKPYLEPTVLHGAFAAATSNMRLCNCVLLAPLRPAVLLAKQWATIDILSRGRCEPVVGTGWSKAEYASLNVDFSARRRILRDNLAACRALWGEQPVTFESETVSFDNLFQMPRPIQKRIPIILAAKANEKNAALVAELCDGWETGPDDSKSLDKLREGSRIYRDAFAAAGRDPKDLIVRAHLPVYLNDGAYDLETIFSVVPGMLDAGVNQFGLGLPSGFAPGIQSMADFGRFLNEVRRMAERF